MAEEPLSCLQLKAFYAVLQAFALETSSMSSLSEKRAEIIENMINELEITDENHTSVTNKIQQNLEILQEMEDSAAMSSSCSVPKPGESWVKPESLNGKWVIIKQSESECYEYKILAYNPKMEMHGLMKLNTNDSRPYRWIDLRQIDPKNLMFSDTPNKPASPIGRSLNVQ